MESTGFRPGQDSKNDRAAMMGMLRQRRKKMAPEAEQPSAPASIPSPAPDYAEIPSYRYAGIPDMPEVEKVTPPPTPPTKEEKKTIMEADTQKEQMSNAARKAARREAKRKAKNQPRDKLFSEAHPQLGSAARNILPRLHVYILMFWLLSASLWEIFHGNIDFPWDWYNGNWFLKGVVGVMMYNGGPWQWVQDNYEIVLVISMLISAVLFTIYETIWTMAFPSYYKLVDFKEYPEGRAYWSTFNGPTRWWDKHYRSPPRTEYRVWIHTKFFLNYLNPRASMIVVTIPGPIAESKTPVPGATIWYKKSASKVVVEEKDIRYITGVDTLGSTDDPYIPGDIQLEGTNKELLSRQGTLIVTTQSVALANPHIRKEQLRKGAIIAPPGFLDVLKRKKELKVKVEPQGGEPDGK